MSRFIVVTIALASLVLLGQQPRAAKRPGKLALPLHTEDRWIVDSEGNRCKLAAVNWYGADQQDYVVGGLDKLPLDAIARSIRSMGFNAVRLQWANEVYERDPVVPDYAVAANPSLKGAHAMAVFDAVVSALTREQVLIILDNHVSRADWCCSETDGNALWYNDDYPEGKWIADWQGMARRYRSNPWVAGADLRNELRGGAAWGGSDPALDWHAAAERAGNAILDVNPNLLIVVEGPNYSLDFRSVAQLPLHLKIADRLVYSPHDYAWDHPGVTSYDAFVRQVHDAWGYLSDSGVPLFLGEFGTCHSAGCDNAWWGYLMRYLAESDMDWAYWPLNGTQSTGNTRKFGAEESYGVLNLQWNAPASPELLKSLQSVARSRQRLSAAVQLR